jgi:hypothetical protein
VTMEHSVPNNVVPINDDWKLGGNGHDPNRITYQKAPKEVTESLTFRIPLSMKEEIKQLLDQGKLAHIQIESYSDFMIDATALLLERIEALEIVGQHYHSTARRMHRQRQLAEYRQSFLSTAKDTLELLKSDVHALQEFLATLLLEKSHLTNEPKEHVAQLDKLIERTRQLLKDSEEG